MKIVLKENISHEDFTSLVEKLRNFGLTFESTNDLEEKAFFIKEPVTDDMRNKIEDEAAVKKTEEVNSLLIREKNLPSSFVREVVVGDVRFRSGKFVTIAGPCAVESEEQVTKIALEVKKSGADMLRGGVFKPRSSPYSFQGLGVEGIKYLLRAKKASMLPVVSELTDIRYLEYFEDVDMIQIGSRNMDNYELLKEVGKAKKPILLKRGMSATIEEVLMSAEYILNEGNDNIVLCERGIRTFETALRNTFDIGGACLLKELCSLPVIFDPSHATGNSKIVPQIAIAAAAAGLDGMIVEVHNDRDHALCDAKQALSLEEFNLLSKNIQNILPYSYKR